VKFLGSARGFDYSRFVRGTSIKFMCMIFLSFSLCLLSAAETLFNIKKLEIVFKLEKVNIIQPLFLGHSDFGQSKFVSSDLGSSNALIIVDKEEMIK
jgi:hypothetical protein